MTIRLDLARLLELEQELVEINGRIWRMVPDQAHRYDNMLMAYQFTAQAARGCERAAFYLQRSIEEAIQT